MYDSIMTYVLCYRFGLVHIMLSFLVFFKLITKMWIYLLPLFDICLSQTPIDLLFYCFFLITS